MGLQKSLKLQCNIKPLGHQSLAFLPSKEGFMEEQLGY